jgi:hypothetical protein
MAAIASGAAQDHAGSVRVEPIPNFDLNRTIFETLEGAATRYVARTRVGKEAHWHERPAGDVRGAYDSASAKRPLPAVDSALLQFMVDECDFNVEHADGSFLDHLYFCFEYGVHHFPQQSPIVLLLHSILGTGTNTFAMGADKIPTLRALMSDFDWRHVEAFPSVLRLLYDLPLRAELWANVTRLSELKSVRMHRVIDNEPIEMSGEDFWIQLNYQLIHLIDFLPAANWSAHANDTAFILFRDLYKLLHKGNKCAVALNYTPASGSRGLVGEKQSFGAWLTTLIPVSASEKMAARAVRQFSERISHSVAFELRW